MRENDTYKLIPYLLYDIPYSLPSNASPALKRQVHLALTAYQKGDFNFEKVSTYLEETENVDFSIDLFTKRDYCIDSLMGIIIQLTDLLKELSQNQSEYYTIIYFNAMGRLRASFESSIVLLRNGYYIESSPIFRLIFEQIAWAYSIIGKEKQEIESMKVTTQIKVLNELIPGSSKVYGPYSQEAHLDPKKIGSYLTIDEELGMVGYSYRSGIRSKDKFYDLFFLANLYIQSIYKFCGRINILDLNTMLQTPDKQIEFSVQERLDGAKQILTIILNQMQNIDGRKYDSSIPSLQIIDNLMV